MTQKFILLVNKAFFCQLKETNQKRTNDHSRPLAEKFKTLQKIQKNITYFWLCFFPKVLDGAAKLHKGKAQTLATWCTSLLIRV